MIVQSVKKMEIVPGYVKMMGYILVGIIPVLTILLIAPRQIVLNQVELKVGFLMVTVIALITTVTVIGMVEIAVDQHV